MVLGKDRSFISNTTDLHVSKANTERTGRCHQFLREPIILRNELLLTTLVQFSVTLEPICFLLFHSLLWHQIKLWLLHLKNKNGSDFQGCLHPSSVCANVDLLDDIISWAQPCECPSIPRAFLSLS